MKSAEFRVASAELKDRPHFDKLSASRRGASLVGGFPTPLATSRQSRRHLLQRDGTSFKSGNPRNAVSSQGAGH